MEKKPDGRRVRMTKLLLKDSLIELMKEKSIHQVSIKEICEGADINRSTFYRHYDTQYDLYDDIIEDIAADFEVIYKQCADEGFNTVCFLTNIFEYIERNREKFLVVLSDKSNIGMGEAYTKITARFINTEYISELGTYIVQFISAGMTSILWTWLNKEERRSAKEVAMLFHTIMMHGLKRAIDFSTNTGKNNKTQ